MVPKGLTNELLELEQELIAKVEVRGKETTRGEKEERLRKFSEGVSRSFCRTQQAFKKFENMDFNTKRFSLIERNVNGALFAYKQTCDEKQKSNKPLWKYF